MAAFDDLIITVEHAGNRVPPRYSGRFRTTAAQRLLASHRGYDPGALAVARAVARTLEAPLFATHTSRLLVEANRSLDHPRLFSTLTAGLPAEDKQHLLARYYHPHRHRVEQAVADLVGREHRVLHLAVHSFTPQLDGRTRTADVGILYDPRRGGERRIAVAWQRALRAAAPGLPVRRNYPYRGTADGFTRYLRRRYCARFYLGIELELNQRLLVGPQASPASRRALVRRVVRSLVGARDGGATRPATAASSPRRGSGPGRSRTCR